MNNSKKQSASTSVLKAIIYTVAFVSLNLDAFSQTPMVRLQLTGPNSCSDETVVYYQSGATEGFDSDFDAYKLTNPTPHAFIAQQFDNTLLQINGVSPVTEDFEIPVLVKTPQTGVYTIFASDFQDIPFGTYINLYDNFTGNYTNLTVSNYTFTLSDTTTAPRFSLELAVATFPVTLSASQPNCHQTMGKCVAEGQSTGPFNYTWKDSTGTIIRTALNVIGADTLASVSFGTFIVNIEDIGVGGFGTDTFTIIQAITPVASFNAPDTIMLVGGGVYTPENLSVNAVGYIWHFSDDNSYANGQSVSHTFVDEGDFLVTLFALNMMGCVDSITKQVNVYKPQPATTVGIAQTVSEDFKWCTLGNSQYMAKNIGNEDFEISIYDLNGNKVMEERSNGENLHFDFSNYSKGIYILNMKSKKTFKRTQCVVE